MLHFTKKKMKNYNTYKSLYYITYKNKFNIKL